MLTYLFIALVILAVGYLFFRATVNSAAAAAADSAADTTVSVLQAGWPNSLMGRMVAYRTRPDHPIGQICYVERGGRGRIRIRRWDGTFVRRSLVTVILLPPMPRLAEHEIVSAFNDAERSVSANTNH